MDVLSDVLKTLRFCSCLYFTTDFRPPWGVSFPSFSTVVRFHLVVNGSIWINVGNESTSQLLEAGDLVLVPHGVQHTLTDAPDRRAVDISDIVREHDLDDAGCLAYGGSQRQDAARLVCGHFEYDESIYPFLGSLPTKIITRRAENAAQDWLDPILCLLSRETPSGRYGGNFMLKRLTEVLFIQTVRNWQDNGENYHVGLFSAISDHHVGRSLTALHKSTEAPWTVESLAREAGLSRTAYAVRFRKLVGQSPMHYVTAWRMQRAQMLLRESDYSIDEIAIEVGYQSPASFARTYRKITGETPGAMRRATIQAGLR